MRSCPVRRPGTTPGARAQGKPRVVQRVGAIVSPWVEDASRGWAGDARPWRDKRDDHGGDVADAARRCLHPMLAATDIRHDKSAVRHRAEDMSRQTRTWVVGYT